MKKDTDATAAPAIATGRHPNLLTSAAAIGPGKTLPMSKQNIKLPDGHTK